MQQDEQQGGQQGGDAGDARGPDDPRALLGDWTFDRVVTDHLASETLTVRGRTSFELVDQDRVRWTEQGTMRRAGGEVEVSRELFVVRRDDAWTVTFSDGRDFHPWVPNRRVEHLCGADTYRGLADFGPRAGAGTSASGPAHEDPPAEQWTLTWWVSGPRKDYEMVTRLTRA